MDYWSLYFLIFLGRVSLVQGFSSFDTNCTIPDQIFSYVQGPNTRGSLQIVWSCLATLTACTYTVLHINVPKQRVGRDGGFSDYLKTWWKRSDPSFIRVGIIMTAMVYPWQTAATLDPNLKCTSVMLLPRAIDTSEQSRLPRRVRSLRDWWLWPNLESVIWAIIIMIVPELYACNALGSRLSASAYKKEFEKLPPHCHPAHGWTLTHTFFANMGGFAVYSEAASLHPCVTHLTAKSLLQLMQDHDQCISAQALSSEEDIQDRSKRNALSKILVLTQISWFILNCITRLIKGLPTTQLEMGIMGTAVCSMVSYLVLFDQPYSVKSAIPVLSFDGDMPTHVAEIVESDSDIRYENGRIQNFAQFDLPGGQQPSRALMAVVFTVLVTSMAAFHLGAWNFAFPTETDKWVWRISSITTCSFVPASGVFLLILFGPLLALRRTKLATTILQMEDKWTKGLLGAPISFLLFTYWAARVVLAVEMIRFLFYIPPGALLTSWADNLPHI